MNNTEQADLHGLLLRLGAPPADDDETFDAECNARFAALLRALSDSDAAGATGAALLYLKLDALCMAWRLSLKADGITANGMTKETVECSLKCYERLRKAMADVENAAGADKSASAPGVVSGIMPLMLRAKGVIEEALRDAERVARRRREKAKPARPTAKK